MDLEVANGLRRQMGMDDQDRVSQASSITTISSLATRHRGEERVQEFGKRCRAVKRDPNCPVVIRGWLFKRDSAGLKLWKRRWFVLSDYCLFYYKDSREECVLGSIPLPSYKVLFCSPRECKNRKYAFKVVHQGMRSYLLSADTQEDMLGWVRALSQSACMETDGINRRCTSYQDFTQIGGSSESVDGAVLDAPQGCRGRGVPGQQDGAAGDGLDHRGRPRVRLSAPEARARSFSLDRSADDHFLSPPLIQGSCPTTPRAHYGSRPHTPIGRVDMRPQDSQSAVPPSPGNHTGGSDRWHCQDYAECYFPPRRSAMKGSHSDQLPPLPPSRVTHNPQLHHSHVPVCVYPPPTHVPSDRDNQTLSALQGDTDMVLTRLCGCDKLLQALSVELAHLQSDKERAQFALEMTRLQLEEWQLEEQEESQKTLLQDELITIRARMCDVSLEMERVWVDYERMESELCVFRSHLQHICHFGLPQERSQAQRQLWMMEDILCGLKANRTRFRIMLGLQRPPGLPSVLQNPSVHPMENLQYMGEEPEPPSRPPLPHELQSTNHGTELRPGWAEPGSNPLYCSTPIDPMNYSSPPTHRDPNLSSDDHSHCGWAESGPPIKKGQMTEVEKRDRRQRHEQRSANKSKHQENPTNQTNSTPVRDRNDKPRLLLDDKPRPLGEGQPSPLRVLRVVSAVLPSSLTARRVCVQDPPPELTIPLPEQIYTQTHTQAGGRSPTNRTASSAHRLLTEHENQNRENLGNPENPEQTPEESRDMERDPPLSAEHRDAKRRRVERIRERVLRSAVRASGVEAVHPLKLIQTREHSDLPILRANRGRTSGSRSLKHRPSGEACPRDGAEDPQSSVQMETSSTNHVSTLTILNNQAESRGTNHVPQNQTVARHNSNCSASTNQRTEWFLSTSQWREFIPINIDDDEQPPPTTANQHSDPSANKKQSDSTGAPEGEELHKEGRRGQSAQSEMFDQNVTDDFGNISASNQPTASPSDQSGTELRIYEEIQYEDNDLKPANEELGNITGGVTEQELNISTNHSAESAAADAGSDVTNGTKTRQPVYSCIIKNSVTNQSASFLKPRVTVVSTSL
ncbi:pleckstrin homology domain-containing family A member 4 isoform X2 [Astyanax mexicanus]|uniref:pleckstrin homology domain-containing family A member 4 isoform X2 n=1 Tax=Astyanax mexicanus TaxID=7994 RepID=UPI0020CB54D9|nr:pleckstrin homology domain-containing family A member 4 isoform X2 [Astyanax mexicanus]